MRNLKINYCNPVFTGNTIIPRIDGSHPGTPLVGPDGYGPLRFYYLALQTEHLVGPEATYRKPSNKCPLSNKHLLSNKRPPPPYTVKLVLNAPCLINTPLGNCPQILGNGEIERNHSIY